MSVVTVLGWLVLAAALCGAAYAFVAAFLVGRFFKVVLPLASDFPAVTILKPLHGAEPGLKDNLESFCLQDYPGPVQIVFGVQSLQDCAIAIVHELQAKYAKLDLTLATGLRREGANPKIANLIGMMPEAKHGTLVLSDSDIGVKPDYLRTIMGALAAPEVGAVTCLYTGRALPNLWSRLSAMQIDYQFLPNAVLGIALGLAKPCFGSTIAIRTSTLGEIGGFEAFRNLLADDYEIGNAVRRLGLKVALPPIAIAHTCAENSAASLVRHELRWARTIRGIDFAGYAGSIVTHALPLSLIAAGLLGFSAVSLAGIVAALASRWFLKLRIDKNLGDRGQPALLLPIRDMLSFAVFAGSFFLRQVDWRGERYSLRAQGQLARE